MDLKVLIAARDVADGGLVEKFHGRKKYTVRKELTLYSDVDGIKDLKVTAERSCVFLMSDSGIEIVSDTTLLIWHTDLRELNQIEEESDLE